MKKLLLLASVALITGCLTTEPRKIKMKREPGDIWWRDRESTAAVVSSGCCTHRLTDEEYFRQNDDAVVRWPDDWQGKHPQPAKKDTRPSGFVHPDSSKTAPEGDLY